MFSFQFLADRLRIRLSDADQTQGFREWLRIPYAVFGQQTPRANALRCVASFGELTELRSVSRMRRLAVPCIHRPKKSTYTNYSDCFEKMRSAG